MIHSRKVLSNVSVLHLKVNLMGLQNIHTFKAKKIYIPVYFFGVKVHLPHIFYGTFRLLVNSLVSMYLWICVWMLLLMRQNDGYPFVQNNHLPRFYYRKGKMTAPVETEAVNLKVELVKSTLTEYAKDFYREKIITTFSFKYGPFKNKFNQHPRYFDPTFPSSFLSHTVLALLFHHSLIL